MLGVVILCFLSEVWWLHSIPIQAVCSGEMRLIPKFHNRTWYSWLENSRPWCISQQLWLGHQIPAYFVSFTDPSIPKGDVSYGVVINYWCQMMWWCHGDVITAEGGWLLSEWTEEEALEKAVKKFNVSREKIILAQGESFILLVCVCVDQGPRLRWSIAAVGTSDGHHHVTK